MEFHSLISGHLLGIRDYSTESNVNKHAKCQHGISPLEGALHFLLVLVGLFDLVGDPRQELFKIGQEVRLVPP